MILERIKAILEESGTEEDYKKLINMLEREDAVDAIIEKTNDGFGDMTRVICPKCGEVVKYFRNKSIEGTIGYCSRCGVRFKKIP